MEVGLAERGDVEPAQRVPGGTLAVEQRVVQIQPVDKEHTAVDGDLQKRNNPGRARSMPRGGG
jgi:hypothetical protein